MNKAVLHERRRIYRLVKALWEKEEQSDDPCCRVNIEGEENFCGVHERLFQLMIKLEKRE